MQNEIYKKYKLAYPNIPILVGWEDVGYQRAGREEAVRRYNIPIELVKRAKDKRSRLETIEPHFANAQIKFREAGDEDVVLQILNFGIETHDDLMDAAETAFTLLITQSVPEIGWI